MNDNDHFSSIFYTPGTFLKDTIIKTVCCWWRNGRIDQWNRTEDPGIGPCKYM